MNSTQSLLTAPWRNRTSAEGVERTEIRLDFLMVAGERFLEDSRILLAEHEHVYEVESPCSLV